VAAGVLCLPMRRVGIGRSDGPRYVAPTRFSRASPTQPHFLFCMLVNTETLASHLDDPSWVIFDCRHDLSDFGKGERLYRESHIPGAHFAPVETELSGVKTGRNGRHPLPDPQTFASFLERHEVSETSTVVAYDDVGGQYSARLWWLARWIGFDGVALLDGGFPKWVAEGRPVSAAIPSPRKGSVRVRLRPEMVWTTADVEQRLNAPASGLVDARSAERYRGETEPIDPVAGHVPGALHRFFQSESECGSDVASGGRSEA